jgi:hypothetical protein
MNNEWYVNTGERLARIETMLANIANRKPCEDCQNVGTIANMKQNLRIINWVGGAITIGALAQVGKWILEKISLPFQ